MKIINKASVPARSNPCLLLLSKTPGCLPVKTRLAADIGSDTALAIYCAFLQDIGHKIQQLGFPLRVHHLPGQAEEKPVLKGLLGDVSDMLPQLGEDLGSRMQHAFECAFAAGHDPVLLIGGDCPDLPPAILQAAFAALADHDCVLGPTFDGGYYLIGFRACGFAPLVFDFGDWGAQSVYGETLQRLQTAGIPFAELAAWDDIDTLAELKRLWQRNQTGWFSNSITMQLLQELFADG